MRLAPVVVYVLPGDVAMRIHVGPWLVQPDMDSIVGAGRSQHVSPKSMEVLLCLARRAGQVVGKEEIFREVWKDTFVSDDSLTRCIGELRRAFQDGTREPTVIRTIAKRGYLLLLPVIWDESEKPQFTKLDSRSAVETDISENRGSRIDGSAAVQVEPTVATRRFSGTWVSAGSVAILLVGTIWIVQRAIERDRSYAANVQSVRTVAVLPLVSLSNDPAQEYFADGMTDELITEIAHLNACSVISRTSVMRYKRSKQPLQEIARELSAEALIEGTVMRSGTRVRITAQLIDAATDKHMWSGSFEREMTDVIALQAGIARAVAQELNLTLHRQNQNRSNAREVKPEAYDAYLQGWYFFDRAQYSKAASHFERATSADPGFARAHALLFESDAMTSYLRDQPLTDRALKAIAMARQLNEDLAETRDAVGDVLSVANWDWEAGLEEYRQAVESDPSSVDAALHYTYALHTLGRWEAATKELARALRVDPVSPAVNLEMLRLLVDRHQYDAAEQQFRKVIELDPNSVGAYYEILSVYASRDRGDEAAAAFLKMKALSNASPQDLHVLTAAAQVGGYRACLKKQIEQLLDKSRREPVSPYVFASLYADLGDKEHALKYLELGYNQHLPRMMWVKARATWDPIRSDRRYQSILQRMHFPEN